MPVRLARFAECEADAELSHSLFLSFFSKASKKCVSESCLKDNPMPVLHALGSGKSICRFAGKILLRRLGIPQAPFAGTSDAVIVIFGVLLHRREIHTHKLNERRCLVVVEINRHKFHVVVREGASVCSRNTAPNPLTFLSFYGRIKMTSCICVHQKFTTDFSKGGTGLCSGTAISEDRQASIA